MASSSSYSQKLEGAFRDAVQGAKTPADAVNAVKRLEADMLKNNPFVPPKNRCPVNEIPPELLAHIFYLGFLENDDFESGDEEDEDEDDWVDEDGDEEEAENNTAHLHSDSLESNDKKSGGKAKQEIMAVDHDESGDSSDEDEDSSIIEEELCLNCGEVHSVADSSSQSSSEDDPRLPFQVLVSHVCRHWRQVAVESPALWTMLNFTEGAPFERSKTWIERSKTLPLDLDIDCTLPAIGDPDDMDDEDYDDDANPPTLFSLNDLRAILEISIPHASRWRTLEVMVNDYKFMNAVLVSLATVPSAPLLEVMQLYHYEDCEEYEEFEPKDLNQQILPFHGNTPKLAHVALWGVHVQWPQALSQPQDSVPNFLSGLTDIELAYHAKDIRPSFSSFATMLRSSPSLHTLTLCLSGPAGTSADWPNPSPENVIELPSLRQLVLCYHEPEYIEPLMQLLSVSNVTSLTLDYDAGDYSSFVRQLAGAPPSDGTKKGRSLLAGLEDLKISGLPCDHRGIDLIYEQLGNLKTLNLSLHGLDGEWFDKLMSPIPSSGMSSSAVDSNVEKSNFYCPNMVAFTTSGVDGHQMRSFVEARKKAGVPLRKVFMSKDDEVTGNDVKWLRNHLELLDFFEPDSESDDEELLEIGDFSDFSDMSE